MSDSTTDSQDGHAQVPPSDLGELDAAIRAAVGEHGFDDDDLLEAEAEEEAVAAADLARPAALDDGALERLERLEQALHRREARKIHRKVGAATLGSAVAGGIPALLDIVNALHLPPALTSLVPLLAAVAGALAAGWATPPRPTEV